MVSGVMPRPFDGDPVFVTEIDDHARGSLMDVLGIQPGHRRRQHCVTDRKPIDRDLILSDPLTSVSCVGSERADTGAASQKVISLAADQGLVSAAHLQGVGASAFHQTITVCQAVISTTADQGVRTSAANQYVAAASPPKQVVARSPVDTVICARVERDADLPKPIGIRRGHSRYIHCRSGSGLWEEQLSGQQFDNAVVSRGISPHRSEPNTRKCCACSGMDLGCA